MSTRLDDKRTTARALATLQAARALLAQPDAWCQGHEAMLRRPGQSPVVLLYLGDDGFAEANAFCMRGAVLHIACRNEPVERDYETFTTALALLAKALPVTGYAPHVMPLQIPIWNDDTHRTVEQVLAVFDQAIEAAKETAQP